MSSLITYFKVNIALVHMIIVRQRMRNNFIQLLTTSDSKRATPRYLPYKKRRFRTRPGRNKVIVPEE